MAQDNVQLNRTFSLIAKEAESSDQNDSSRYWGDDSETNWSDLDKEYRVVILADAGAGKTFETLSRAEHIEEQGHKAFFIRIEDIDSDFEDAFEVGDASKFADWLNGSEEAWFFLDSVDEARLESPKAFEKAIKQFSRRINQASHRVHVYVTSRPFSWRFKEDRMFIEQHLPFTVKETEREGDTEEFAAPEDDGDESKSGLQVYSLNPLDESRIRLFSQSKSASNIDQLLEGIHRANILELAARPFDLEALLLKWNKDASFGSRLELMQSNIGSRLDEITPARSELQPLNRLKARDGARLLAAAVTLTGDAGILVPDGTSLHTGFNAEYVLADWHPSDVKALLERGIFNDIIYGAVRFRHREIRELLMAEWLYELLQSGNSRRQIEDLIFKEQYGEQVITPIMRPILPWLVLFDEAILSRVLAISPGIVLEGGDPSRLPLKQRQLILTNVVAQIVRGEDDRSARGNAAIARIAQLDLSADVKCLISKYADNGDAIFFLGRLVWQGNMTDCLEVLQPISLEPKADIYARVAAVRAIVTLGNNEQKLDVWHAINQLPVALQRKILAELLSGKVVDGQSIEALLVSINKLSPYNKYRSSGVSQHFNSFIDRIPLKEEELENPLLLKLVSGLNSYLNNEPYHSRREYKVSQEFYWLMSFACHAVEKLIVTKSIDSFDPSVLSILLKIPAIRSWGLEGYDDYKHKLEILIPDWPKFNDELFWSSVTEARLERSGKGERLIDCWGIRWYGPLWKYDGESFPRILDMIKDKSFEDDKLVALSLAWEVYRDSERPSGWEGEIRRAVTGNQGLEKRFSELMNPPSISEEQQQWREEDARRDLESEHAETEKKQKKFSWIKKLRSDPSIVLKSPEPGEITYDQHWLYDELSTENDNYTRGKYGSWQSLIPIFGIDVAQAFRTATLAHWRAYQPGLFSEGADINTIPCSLKFAMTGLEIELHEIEGNLSNLTDVEVTHALRYVVWELNGFPRWFESIYKHKPNLVLNFIWTELYCELESVIKGTPVHYILQNLASGAPWLHSGLMQFLPKWLESSNLQDHHVMGSCLRILINGGVDQSWLSRFAKKNIDESVSVDQCPSWYSLWIDTEARVGIESLEQWLSALEPKDSILAAQKFINDLLSDRDRGWNGSYFKNYQTVPNLKRLYLLMHKYIKADDDLRREGGGSFTVTVRDDAQRSRDRLFSLLSEIPGGEAYTALVELAESHTIISDRSWMAATAYRRAEQDADLEKWVPQQIHEFSVSLNITPKTHRQLFDLGTLRLHELKDWLERGDDSQASLYQKAGNEDEMRQAIAYWLRQKSNNKYSCNEEIPLANNQRPDIRLQNIHVSIPVSIELKLLDKSWSGPHLCERLRNQLAGDYLREEAGGRGIFLLVWQGKQIDKQWEIDGARIGVSSLSTALKEYWLSISSQFPNVSAIEVIVIDLSMRTKKSDT
jgi:hypothetical protein